MCERRAIEHVRIRFQLPEDNLAIRSFLRVEGLIGAYVVNEGHGGIVVDLGAFLGRLKVK